MEQAAISRWSERVLNLISLAATIVISWQLVSLVLMITGGREVQPPPKLFGSQPASAQSNPLQQRNVDPGAIPLWNLFGREGESKQAASREVDAPKTQLQLELQAVFVATEEDRSTAIIAERMQEAKLYHIGDMLPGNATLAGVMHDRVLLNRMGSTEALFFPDADGRMSGISPGGGSYGATTRPVGGTMGASDTAARDMNAGMSAGMPPANEMARALREEMSGNPAQTLKEMGLESNGGRGYRISDASNPMFAALGARPGDLLISVNGRPVGNIESDLAGLEGFLEAETLTIELDRNGKRFSTEVPLR